MTTVGASSRPRQWQSQLVHRFVREPCRLPAVLSVEEITLRLEAVRGSKYKVAFATAYGAGLRCRTKKGAFAPFFVAGEV